jgi:hypothetical protein
MLIRGSLEQPMKAHFPILVTESGMTTDFRLEQFRKAYTPILVTEFGIITDVRFGDYRK